MMIWWKVQRGLPLKQGKKMAFSVQSTPTVPHRRKFYTSKSCLYSLIIFEKKLGIYRYPPPPCFSGNFAEGGGGIYRVIGWSTEKGFFFCENCVSFVLPSVFFFSNIKSAFPLNDCCMDLLVSSIFDKAYCIVSIVLKTKCKSIMKTVLILICETLFA